MELFDKCLDLENSMLGPYIPIMRPKEGELKALQMLSADTLKQLAPFFDFHRPPYVKKVRKPFDKHIVDTCRKITKHWNKEGLFFFDLYLINLKERINTAHPISWISSYFSKAGYSFVPTIGTDRDDSYLEALKSAIKDGLENGICVRLLKDDLEFPEDTSETVLSLLNSLEVASIDSHLLIDFKYTKQSDIPAFVEALTNLGDYLDFSKWMSLTVSGSGFPEDMTGLPANSITPIPRTELYLWKSILKLEPLLGIKPFLSDYCIVHPEAPDVDPVTMRAGGKIRYATKECWMIFRGYSLQKNERYNQYFNLAQQVVNHECYLGNNTSWGDRHYEECSKNMTTCGNLTTWVKVDTNHHLTIIAEQVSNLVDS